ncbi:Phage repressor protein C, contains Cro/C1-type HTH and peptisase s24 domains [Azospirillum oryzae]|uniref:Phage repressor protein C, contains Cro/C1-type HTH and peptisase s24 domains n=1 Tax=Azospirillum oryzae TaxID=286727 RepID=A0A1X7HBJ3_9PROT|nr:LexA family transcriptional regulator [Azospirillum oryzae]SMF83376.1 Phage repressor protein C, contains Cro/C1-type HTH and peptisase s24 domains [Azospirillum oryzae]
MSTLRELRQAAGLSQEKLAELAGTSQPQINKLEAGQRKMTVDWAVKLAKPLGVEPAALLGLGLIEPPLSGSELKNTTRALRNAITAQPQALVLPNNPHENMPVRAAARGGVDQEMFLEDGPIDWVKKPDYLKNARDPYGMYVVGESMMPRFRPAQILHINPYKPPACGAGVIVVKRNQAILIKEFVRRSPEGVVLREYQPEAREFTVAEEDLDTVHTVVGLQEP